MIHFLSGLPRSGSTLLGAILSQNPKFQVSPTNDLAELVGLIKNSWVNFDGFRAQGLQKTLPRIKDSMKGLLQGFYREELAQGKIIFDKSRAWPAFIEVLEDILERPVRIICPVRDLKEVVASFETLRAKHPLTAPFWNGTPPVDQQNIWGRTQALFSVGGMIGLAMQRIIDAFDRNLGDRLCVVRYKELIEEPQLTVMQISQFLGTKPFQVETENLVGPDTSRDIDVWGIKYHGVRPQLDANHVKWQEVIPEELGKWIDNQFPQMQALVR